MRSHRFEARPTWRRSIAKDYNFNTEEVSIIIDSGADAPVFPSSMIHCGRDHSGQEVALQDAQGRQIPVLGQKAVSVLLQDASGTEIELQDNVVFSSEISQPILSYGRLMNAGWSICAEHRCLKNGNYEIPLEFQNNSLVVKGHVRSVDVGAMLNSSAEGRAICWSSRVRGKHLWLEQGRQQVDWSSLSQPVPEPLVCAQHRLYH